ncbi:magnesium transporter [Methylonatrum kenyense]|uniref:magnesium transporter n=1 Tax=Methylonatrum kenyense TaxID=455253 RepID=UPI0020BD6816|nr:magnesium transporter [Methylonatrum kenyense]MCK8517344.1 magnesium transporter [Methylonatrum kenyense]
MLLDSTTIDGHAEAFSRALEEQRFDNAIRDMRRVSLRRSARILAEAPLPALLPFFRAAGWERAGAVAAHFPREFTVSLLNDFPDEEAGSLLANMPPGVIAHLVRLLPEQRAAALLDQFDPEYRDQVMGLVRYPEGTAGAEMSPYFLGVDSESSVGEVIEVVRQAPPDSERGTYVYLLDHQGRLNGVISLRDLMLSANEQPVAEVMRRDVLAARTDDPALEAARRIRTRRLKLLPIVDHEDRLQGVMTINEAMDLLAQEIADEFVAVSAASADESFFTPPRQAVRKRLPWMAANIFLNLGAVVVISSFEETLIQVAILAAFLPMITDMGGNVGIQALSVSIRSMALGEARLRDFWKAMRKEMLIGIMNGVALGLLFTLVAWVMQGNMVLGLVAGTALAVNVLVAGVVGGTIPFLIKRLGKDPAMMTGPILTTITDITGVSIYLGLATLFLSGLLGG